ncbi:MAG: chemotaxis protein CheC [Minisyncoccales bacterium]
MDAQYQLTKEGIGALEKMSHNGAKNASESLSKLINQDVEVKALAARATPIEKISEIIGSPEDMVTTVIMEITGEVIGNIMLIYPHQSAINVADFLAKRKFHATVQLNELDKSAIKESGNIIAGSFLSAVSNYLHINMVESIPDIATDMLKATMDFVLAKFAKRDIEEVMAFEIDFEMGTTTAEGTEKISAYFILLLDIESANKILKSLKKISGGAKMTSGGLINE